MSSASDTVIANLALGFLGVSKQIADLETERSKEASVLRTYFADVRQEVLRDFDWSFATATQALTKVADNPTSEWNYSYQYPADCVKFRHILSGIRNNTKFTSVPFRIVKGAAGKLILTDKENAEGEWTLLDTESQFYPSDFKLAFAMKLAIYASSALTAGDPFKVKQDVAALYGAQIAAAKVNSANEASTDPAPESEFITVRDGCTSDDYPWRYIPPVIPGA